MGPAGRVKRWVLAHACAIAVLATGCATKPPTAEEEVAVWLSEAPRVLVVSAAPQLPTPVVRVRDHRPAERVGKGAASAVAGAGMTVYAGCHLGPFGCIVGAVLAPIGAVVGGVVGVVSVDSVDIQHPLTDAKGAPELYQAAAKPDEVTSLLARAVVAEGEKTRKHSWRMGAAPTSVEGELKLAIRAIDLAGDVSEDPSAALVLEVEADIATPEANVYRWARYWYRGRWAPIAEWRENDAKLFRAELAKAAESIAGQIVRQVHAGPDWGAASRVAAARERRMAPVPERTAR